ncbi:hypothetical protein A2Y26_03425 [candidate division CPR2 bacterium GWD2_39_7]|nr:MAG: hypothetical protein A2Y27_00615 [candidate division CPR2 bacterium GWD1_39_7]OGB72567.1 MAG: hypothetical protein A2Y26_03425 [candidate division CPR2 bacterium GWD2_39_7]
MLIDTHAHLNFPGFKSSVNEILKRAEEAGVTRIINVGSSLEGSLASDKLSKKYENIYATIGLHPHVLIEDNLFEEEKEIDVQLEKLEELALENNKIVAVGEIGLDYFRMPENYSAKDLKNAQRDLFIRQLELAYKLGLPIIIHSRDAVEDTLEIMNEFKDMKAVFHCFSYDLSVAKRIVDNGWLISFTANITYPKNFSAKEVIKNLPLEQLMIETDAPFLAPQEKRGQINEPANVIEVAKKIAEIKNISLEDVACETMKNARDFFGF